MVPTGEKPLFLYNHVLVVKKRFKPEIIDFSMP
jgi:hypothetical protein